MREGQAWTTAPPSYSLVHVAGSVPFRSGGSVSAGHAPGIFFDPCPTSDLLGGALSAVRAQCNYLDA